jgi:hypothetical protein
MILNAYNKSEIARLYFLKQGDKLTKQQAANRWRMIIPNKKTLKEVFKEVYKSQLQQITDSI